MHILLTDILTCPRCGPEFGLILLADRIADRRVLHGVLGCANCRERYVVEDGFGTLGHGWASDPAATPADGAVTPPEEETVRIAAMLGVTEGHGFVLLVGDAAVHAPGLAAMIPGLEVVAASDAARTWTERPGVSRIRVGRTLPFLSRSLRGAALTADAADKLLEEAARSVGALGRLVLLGAPPDAEQRLAPLELSILARQGSTLVAVRG